MKRLAYIGRSALRSPTRSLLTLAAVAAAMFLFVAMVSLDHGMRRMLGESARDDVLVVFDRFQGCPPLSKLPADHARQIAEIDGVADVTSELFVVSSCSRATNVVSLRGVDPQKVRAFRNLRVDPASWQAFAAEPGAALVGRPVAERFGWRVGDPVVLSELGGTRFTVRGFFEAPGDSLEHSILIDLGYLQRATDQVGTITLVHARMDGTVASGALAAAIDARLAGSTAPTRTAPEQAFITAAVAGLAGIVEFSTLLGYVALGVVVIGVGNGLSISIRDRTREIAILKTVGYQRGDVLQLTVGEAVVSAVLGGGLGSGAAWAAARLPGLSLSVEGFTFTPEVSPQLVAAAVILSAVLGLVAGFFPAFRAARLRAVNALREVNS